MSLAPGHYHIQGEREGYHTARQWVTIQDRDIVVDMMLERIAMKREADTTASSSTPSKTWRNPLGMEFVLIPSGRFQMGSTSGDDDEKPVHSVEITQPFYLGTTEVTQSQWESVMGHNPSGFKRVDRPVENVSWEDVQSFIEKLNGRERGVTYRLPTEAEWEYAARAGTTTAYSFGDSEKQLDEYAWYSGNSGSQTHSVGQKRANGWGLYDMHGNVWEWVSDWYASDYYKRSLQRDPSGPPSGTNRVIRGGSWNNDARNCRSANRNNGHPGNRNDNVGFRLLSTWPSPEGWVHGPGPRAPSRVPVIILRRHWPDK
jgi:formylglycine-generating enzyme required for sulfatase activity